MITNRTMKNLSVNAYHQYWQHIAYIEKAIWNELFVCLDLCQERYWSTLTYSSCCWCAKRASEHFLTISPLFSLSTRERARSHIHIQTRCDEDERVWASISFHLKTRETLNKESIHLLFLLLLFFILFFFFLS